MVLQLGQSVTPPSTLLLMAIPYLGQQLSLGQELWTKLSWQPNSLSH